MSDQPTREVDTAKELLRLRAQVADLARLEHAARRREAAFRALAENAQDIVKLLDRDLRHVYVNPAFERITGVPRSEVIGKTDRQLGPEPLAERWETALRRVLQTGEPCSVEHQLLAPDGERQLEALCAPVPGQERAGVESVLVVARDVTARMRAEAALRESEAKYRAVIEQSAENIFLVELESRRIVESNRAMRSLLDYSPEEMHRLTLYDVVAHPRADIDERIDEVVRGLHQVGERRYRRRDGATVPVEVGAALITVEGRRFLSIVSRDLTSRLESEEERRILEARIQHTQKLESLGVLAGGVAHDFNNLLTSILGNVSYALAELPPASAQREVLQEIETAAQRAAELTAQMLAYSGRGRYEVEHVKLPAVIEELAHLLRASVPKSCALRFSFAPDVPFIGVDVAQLRQLVMNLITNAGEAMGDKDGTIDVRVGPLVCSLEQLSDCYAADGLPEGLYVSLEVADTGCGMSPETKQRIFDPFFTTKFTGRGLGLAAVFGIVRGHRGAIRVSSELRRGSTFQVLFPAADMDMDKHRSRDVQPVRGEGLVLVVDDEPGVRQLVRRVLERSGFTVLVAESGPEGIDLFNRHGTAVRLVLLDLTMPGAGGETVFAAVRAVRRDVPVIISSGYAEEEARRRIPEWGVAGFLHKPYTAARLVSLVGQVLKISEE